MRADTRTFYRARYTDVRSRTFRNQILSAILIVLEIYALEMRSTVGAEDQYTVGQQEIYELDRGR